MVTNWRPRYPLWQAVINYFNECYNDGRTPTRKNMLQRLREHGFSGSINSIDSYRNYLHQAGYIGTIRRGIYSIDDLIPSDLSVDDCRSHAYGGMHPIPEVPRVTRIARREPRQPILRVMGREELDDARNVEILREELRRERERLRHPEPVNVVDELESLSASSSSMSSTAASGATIRDPRTGIEFLSKEEMEL